jgi:Thioredoxin-like domain
LTSSKLSLINIPLLSLEHSH